jgi:hypothetical protein
MNDSYSFCLFSLKPEKIARISVFDDSIFIDFSSLYGIRMRIENYKK